ncbi:DUF2281 domain-containing protein [Phaeodactylibacter sp.]|uniref:DUF2281 domain-containing protein n=1 Tax=Phaeodactylibacter sp. TaxID=1940289 RepID=UPI0025DE3DFA|nr:DUF2281 domain-containing protein [Phaeodactylibacter sp.]MCI4646793.1 DUF2281 domain-containing protein [Phaeodactylibacter sp.]MCI5091732.1 DUF2281 domain-containing protein [Phaeodactylibacter sp.]
MSDQQILAQLNQLPAGLKKEVEDFISFLLFKYESRNIDNKNRVSEKKAAFSEYRAVFQNAYSMEEIDFQLDKLRDEWERNSF